MPRTAALPNDVQTLQRLLLAAEAKLLSRELEIEQLKLQIARLRRMQFGRSSEQLSEQISQLELKLEELETQEATLPPSTSPTSAARKKSVRRPLPAHLPREQHIHEPQSVCSCPACGGAMRPLGEDIAEMLEYGLPPRFQTPSLGVMMVSEVWDGYQKGVHPGVQSRVGQTGH